MKLLQLEPAGQETHFLDHFLLGNMVQVEDVLCADERGSRVFLRTGDHKTYLGGQLHHQNTDIETLIRRLQVFDNCAWTNNYATLFLGTYTTVT